MGFAAFLMEAVAPELLIETFNEDQLAMYNDRPSWYMYNFAIAVFAGTLSCIFLFLRKKFAITLAVISLLAVIISSIYTVYSGALDFVTTSDKILFYMVLILDVVLVFFARYATKRNWLN